MNRNMVEAKGGDPATWSAAIAALSDRLTGARELLHPYSCMSEEDFRSGSVQVVTKSDYPPSSQFISRHLSVKDVTQEEVLAAPQAIRMVLRDFGLAEGDSVVASVVFKNMDNVQYSPRHFWLVLQPSEVTDDHVGVILSSSNAKGRENNVVPRSLLHPLQGRAKLVYNTYASDMVPNLTLHPYLVEILSAGAEWMSELLNNRLSSKPTD